MIKITPDELPEMTKEAKQTKRRYWINTVGKKPIFISLITKEPSFFAKETFLLKECNAFTYYLFMYLKINLKAENKLAWLRN